MTDTTNDQATPALLSDAEPDFRSGRAAAMSLRITVEDIETGDRDEATIGDGDYFIVTTEPCRVDGIQTYPKAGTHVLTIKSHNPKPVAGGQQS